MKKHEIFITNPDLKEVYMTSDTEAFFKESDAKNHAKTLKDKSIELVVNPLQIETIIDDFNEDDEQDNFNSLKISEGIKEPLTGIVAATDGSENVLIQAKTEGTVLVNLTEVSVEDTQKEINKGGNTISIEETPKVEASKVETPKVEAPIVEAPKVETPKAEAPKVETKNSKAPKAETPKAEAPKVEAKNSKAPKVEAPKAEAPKAETPEVNLKNSSNE